MKKIVILISGRGSNMASIAQACAAERWPARIVAVIGSRPDGEGLARAAELGLTAEVRAGGEAAGDSVHVLVSAERGLPPEAALRIRLVHPGRSGADRVALLSRVSAAADGSSGEYRGAWDEATELHASVAWRVVLEGQQWRLDGGIAPGEARAFRLVASR